MGTISTTICHLLQRCRPALRQAITLPPRLASAQCSLANGCRFIFLSAGCVRSKIGAPPVPQPPLLCGAAVFERFRRRPPSRWAPPRCLVRRSRPDTSCLLAHADGALLARIAGSFSRCPLSLSIILGSPDTYSSHSARYFAARSAQASHHRARSRRVCDVW